MTRQEKDKVIATIKKCFHIEYVGNGYPKMVMTTDNLSIIEKELEEMIDNGRQ